MKYYSLKRILSEKAIYNLIIGERSNGKTYSVLEYALKDFCESDYTNQLGIIRRWGDDFKGKRGQQMFDALVTNQLVKKYTNGKWESITYRSSQWFLSKYDEKLDKMITMAKPFAFGFSLNAVEHDKSTSYPNIKTVLFDEFLTRTVYLNEEFVLFMNTLSTIIRERDDVKVFMCGNTVNKYSPYFTEMGIKGIDTMKQGEIRLYRYGDSKLTLAIEYCSPTKDGKKSNIYFAFDNAKLNMITGGAWEMNLYPHLPFKYKDYNVKSKFFIDFNNSILQCEVIKVRDGGLTHTFIFIHRKTTPLKELKRDRIYTDRYNSSPNYRRYLTHPIDELDKLYLSFFKSDKVFFQDNEVGEEVRNYLNWSMADKGVLG